MQDGSDIPDSDSRRFRYPPAILWISRIAVVDMSVPDFKLCVAEVPGGVFAAYPLLLRRHRSIPHAWLGVIVIIVLAIVIPENIAAALLRLESPGIFCPVAAAVRFIVILETRIAINTVVRLMPSSRAIAEISCVAFHVFL